MNEDNQKYNRDFVTMVVLVVVMVMMMVVILSNGANN